MSRLSTLTRHASSHTSASHTARGVRHMCVHRRQGAWDTCMSHTHQWVRDKCMWQTARGVRHLYVTHAPDTTDRSCMREALDLILIESCHTFVSYHTHESCYTNVSCHTHASCHTYESCHRPESTRTGRSKCVWSASSTICHAHTSHINQSCHLWLRWHDVSHVINEWVMSHMRESCHVSSRSWKGKSHEPCDISRSRGTYQRVMWHINGSCHISMSPVTYQWVMSYTDESCDRWQGDMT